jgi:uncharacterized membrane protein
MTTNKVKSFFSAKNVSMLGVLLALVVVLQLWGSAIPMFGVTLNLSLIPIALGGIFFGAFGGGLVGFAAGTVTFITCALMGQEPSTAFLFQHSPVILTITCFGKTTVAGIAAGALYSLLSKKIGVAATFISSLAVPVVNTALYVVGMLLMTSNVAEYLQIESSAGTVFVVLMSVIWLNAVLEIATTILLSPAVGTIVRVTEKQIQNKREK